MPIRSVRRMTAPLQWRSSESNRKVKGDESSQLPSLSPRQGPSLRPRPRLSLHSRQAGYCGLAARNGVRTPPLTRMSRGCARCGGGSQRQLETPHRRVPPNHAGETRSSNPARFVFSRPRVLTPRGRIRVSTCSPLGRSETPVIAASRRQLFAPLAGTRARPRIGACKHGPRGRRRSCSLSRRPIRRAPCTRRRCVGIARATFRLQPGPA